MMGLVTPESLAKLGVTDLLVCGMMTQNCVTHTAISKAAEKYDVAILPDCCTSVSEILVLPVFLWVRRLHAGQCLHGRGVAGGIAPVVGHKTELDE